MKIIYSGKTKEFTPDLEEKIRLKLAKLGKFLERRGEREVHLMHQSERHLHRVEITMNFYDHGVVGEGVDADLPAAIHQAIEKLEKQLVRIRERWRDSHRTQPVTKIQAPWTGNTVPGEEIPALRSDEEESSNPNGARRPKIFRVDYDSDRKPMTLEEAMLEMERNVNYVVYRDANRQCLSVLVRRPDGNYDLIES
jgi:putative sigma-54 modulation protein